MGRRLCGHVLAGVLGLCGPLGCQTAGSLGTGPVGGPAAVLDGSKRGEPKELPPAQAANLCLDAAKEMENGHAEVQAIGLYEKARLDDPRKEPLVCRRLAVLYDRQGNFEKSLQEYQRALQLSPKDADLLNDLGYSYYSHGKLEEAEKYLRQALASKGNHPRAWVNLGLTLGAQGRFGDSLEAFLKAVPPAQAHCNLAFLLTTQKMWEQAKQEYRKAIELDANMVMARAALDRLEHPHAAAAKGPLAESAQAMPALTPGVQAAAAPGGFTPAGTFADTAIQLDTP
jgi:Tfp pilus assembly protein PilF